VELTNTTPVTTTQETDDRTLSEKAGFDQDTFLKIFLAQLEHQDPLNPQDTTQLSAQLAQFSQLEQALRTNIELGSIGSSLEELIEIMGGRPVDHLDPLSMLGKQVDYPGSEIAVTEEEFSTALTFELTEPANSLSILVGTSGELPIARVVLPDPGSEEEGSVALPPGSYFLQFTNGEPKLAGPNGAAISLDFRALNDPETGQIIDYQDAPPFGFGQGVTYQFSGVSVSDYESVSLAFDTTGIVDSVLVEEGAQVLSVNGNTVDPSSVVRIREYMGAE
jgi:hypothetical protein